MIVMIGESYTLQELNNCPKCNRWHYSFASDNKRFKDDVPHRYTAVYICECGEWESNHNISKQEFEEYQKGAR